MADPRGAIDSRLARRRFERAASSYAAASPLEAEIGARMLERLELVRITPRRVLDAGCGPGRHAQALAARYRGALLLGLDYSVAMLREARRARPWLRRVLGAGAQHGVAGGLEAMPLAAASVDLLWSNMALHWTDTRTAIAEFARVLRPGGLLMLSTLGPDTLRELRAAAGETRVHRFEDMHDLGDALVGAGFGAPVMDMERVTMTYASAAALLDDLRRSGQACARRDAPRGLRTRGAHARLCAALDARAQDGRVAVTWEVIYGHAWRGEPRRGVSGEARIPVEIPRRGRAKS